MFKKFYFSSIISIFLITFISSLNKPAIPTYIFPVKIQNSISSYYGKRILLGKNNFHNGIDIAAKAGTPIYSIENGIIKYIGFDASGYGIYIIILHNNSYKSLYGHVSEHLLVNIGDNVIKGQLIAYIGDKILSNGKRNGNTTGPHLHFSIFSDNGESIDPFHLQYEEKLNCL